MRRVAKKREDSKVKKTKVVNVKRLQDYERIDVDSKVALIRELIPLGLMHIEDMLQEEVTRLAGEKYRRNGQTGRKRWGSQRGSVYVKDQKLPIKVQRVRDVTNNREVSLSAYERFQQPTQVDEGLMRRVLHGLSTRNYRECAATSLLYIEGRLNKASGYKYLSRLREVMRKEIEAAKAVKGNIIAA